MIEFGEIAPPDGSARARAREAGGAGPRVSDAHEPFGLGTLGAAAAWLAGCQGTFPPRVPADVRVCVFAAEHGVAAQGVSARPAGSTSKLVAGLSDGRGALPAAASAAGASLQVINAGPVSGSIDVEDALDTDALNAALGVGRDAADAAVDSGAQLLVASNVGAGSTTAVAALVAVLTSSEPVSVVGRGSGVDDDGWIRKTRVVRDAARRSKPHLAEPLSLLAAAGGADIAALCGFLTQAATRRTPVLLSGTTVLAAGMIAEEIAPGAREWWHAGCRSTEPAYDLLCVHLDLTPLLPVDLDGDGELAGVLALPSLLAAVTIAAESF